MFDWPSPGRRETEFRESTPGADGRAPVLGRPRRREIGRFRGALLVLHGDADEVVPYEHGRRLYEAASEPKAFYTIAGAHHNDTYFVGGSEYWEAWRKFLDRLPPSP